MLADDPPADAAAWFAGLAEHLAATLERCGLPRCPGDVMATNPARRLPRRAWQQQFASWIQEPEEEALLDAAICFDFRQLHGDLDAEAALRPVIRQAAGNRRFLGRLARAALRRRPPLGFLRQLRGDHQGRVDLKAHGTAPIVDLARLLALEAASAELATVARLRAATERRTVGRTAADLAAAFDYLQEVRLRHQAGQLQAGSGPRRHDRAGRPGGAGAPLAQGCLRPVAHLPGKRPHRLPDRPDRLSMRRLRAARRRRQARRALARADLPEPVRVHLSAPKPPDRLPWRQVTYTVLDLETTGLDPATDAIVAAGGLRVLDGRAAAATAFRLLVRPDHQVPTAAIRIHGLLPGELAAAPPLAEQLATLLDRTLGDVLVVHVAEVDQAFLDAAMRRLWGCPLNATVLDTARMAAALNRRLQLARPPGRRPGTSLRLADLARAHGLPVHPEHDPLHDALTTAQLFLALATRLERHGRGTLGALRRVAGRT